MTIVLNICCHVSIFSDKNKELSKNNKAGDVHKALMGHRTLSKRLGEKVIAVRFLKNR